MTLYHAGTATTVTLTGRIEPRFPLDIQPVRQQNVGEYEDGELETYDRDVTVWTATFEIRGMTQAQLASLRNFFVNIVKGSKNAFTLTPGASVDLGAGNGTAVTCKLIGKLPPHRLYGAPALYSQRFTVRYKSTGTSVPS